MKYIVLELMDETFPAIVTDTDGIPLIFDNLEDAEVECNDCQNGKIVEI